MLEKIMAKAFAAPLLRKAQKAATDYLPMLSQFESNFPLNEDEQCIIAVVKTHEGKPIFQLRMLNKDNTLGEMIIEHDLYELLMSLKPEDIENFQKEADKFTSKIIDKA